RPAPPPTFVGPRSDDRALIVGRAAADDAGTRLGRGRAVAAVHLVIPVVGIGATAGIEERRGPPTRRPRAVIRTRLDEADPTYSGLGEGRSDRATGGAGADDDDIERHTTTRWEVDSAARVALRRRPQGVAGVGEALAEGADLGQAAGRVGEARIARVPAPRAHVVRAAQPERPLRHPRGVREVGHDADL